MKDDFFGALVWRFAMVTDCMGRYRYTNIPMFRSAIGLSHTVKALRVSKYPKPKYTTTVPPLLEQMFQHSLSETLTDGNSEYFP